MCRSKHLLVSDDTNIFREIKTEEDRKHLQDDLDKLQQLSDTWLLKFHPNKCKVMSKKTKTINGSYNNLLFT